MEYSDDEVKEITQILSDRVFNIHSKKDRRISKIDDSLNSLQYEISFSMDKKFVFSVELKNSKLEMCFDETNIRDYEFLTDFFNSSIFSFKREKGKLCAYFIYMKKEKESEQ